MLKKETNYTETTTKHFLHFSIFKLKGLNKVKIILIYEYHIPIVGQNAGKIIF